MNGARSMSRDALTAGILLCLLLALLPAPAAAQDEEPTRDEPALSHEDSLLAALAEKDPRLAALKDKGELQVDGAAEPLFKSLKTSPKGGVKATVQKYSYYGELESILSMRGGSQVQNRAAYSWDDYRSYDKVVESRSNRFNYLSGGLMPFYLDVNANWDWSEDSTVNSQGVTNLIKRDNRNAGLKFSKNELRTGALLHDLTAGIGMVDESSENRGAASERDEANARFHLQTGWELDPGLVLAGRFHGEGAQGDRLLRHRVDTAKSLGDSLGAGAYYDRGWLVGRAVLTQSTFESEFLDWRRNDRGAPDTTGITVPDDQIVRERKVAKKQAIVLENEVRFGRVGLELNVARTVDETAYAKSGQGTQEKFEEKVNFQATFATSRDSFVAAYEYKWVWDDQYLQAGTRRGRQNKRRLDAGVKWYRPFFQSTRLAVVLDQSLDQQIPDDRPNGQNKDILRTAASAGLRRAWGDSDVELSVRWNQSQDLAIGSDKSIENNTRDRYEISPEFTWQMRDWVRLSQEYTLYIEYRDYDYSDDSSRQDSYDKRGNLTSFLTFDPTSRLRVSLKHQYNRFFKAKRTGEAAGGGSVYTTNSSQTISQIDFSLSFEPVDGVFLETSTFRGRDHKLNPQSGSESSTYKGKVITGLRAKRKWGSTNPVEIQASVEKVNAFGPGIRPASADYWTIDSWVKWSF
ncbi:MAG: hypothetical protein GY838_19255 [bacterium]|nr:hypothetical protein [bacterium]